MLTIKIYSQDIGMEFGTEKWKRKVAEEIELPNQESFKTLEEKENYCWVSPTLSA